MPRVLVLGSSNADMIVHLPHLPARGETVLGGGVLSRPGGKGANQAVAAPRAGAEVVGAAVWAGAAARAVTRGGAQGGMPSRAEIDRLAARVLEGRWDDGETTRPVAF